MSDGIGGAGLEALAWVEFRKSFFRPIAQAVRAKALEQILGSGEPIDETNRRREIQEQYNEEHGIVPTTINKNIRAIIESTKAAEDLGEYHVDLGADGETMDIHDLIAALEKEMMEASMHLNFEVAAEIRDRVIALKKQHNID